MDFRVVTAWTISALACALMLSAAYWNWANPRALIVAFESML